MKLPDQRLCIFLSFTGNAEQAMRFYADKLPGAQVESLTLYEKSAEMGDEGKVLNGVLSLLGQKIMFMDMGAGYPAPPFNWSSSLLINNTDEAEFDACFAALSEGGTVMMGPEPVMHMRKCAWVTDKFGVTWQLVWE